MTLSTSVPPTRREDVVDTYHGTPVADPYRWLEDGDDAEVVAWVAAQNELTRSMLDVPARADWHRRLVELMELPVLQHAVLRGDQPVLLRASGRRRAVRAHPAIGRSIRRRIPSCCSTRRRSATTRRRRSTGTTRRATDRWSPSASARAGPSSPCCTSSPAPTARRPAATAIASPTPGRARWPGSPTDRGSSTSAIPAGDEYNRTVHHHRLGTDWRDDPVVWDDRPDPQAWPDVLLTPGRPLAGRQRRGRLPAHGRPRPRSPRRPVVDD